MNCPNCNTENFTGTTFCKQCGNRLNQSGVTGEWYIRVEGQQYGPYSLQQMIGFIGESRLTSSSLVWREGYPEWVNPMQVPELAPYLPTRHDTKKPRKKGKLGLIAGILIAVALVVAGVIFIPSVLNKTTLNNKTTGTVTLPITDAQLGKGDGTVTLELGKEISTSVESSKADDATIFSITDKESPVNGLSLEIPGDAYNVVPQVSISTTEIKGSDFGEGFVWVTPVVHVDNGGDFAQNYMKLTIPCNIGEDETALAFYIEPETGALEPITVAEQGPEGVTLLVRHFSDIAVAKVSSKITKEFETVGTGFTPGVDDFSFENHGSFIAPKGHCLGQSLSAIWYYVNRKASQGSLFSRFDNFQKKDLGFNTPNYQDDDTLAYRLCSVAQVSVHWDPAKYENACQRSDRDTYINIITALHYGQPQLINIFRRDENNNVGGHAIIAYRSEPGKIYVSDPNYPGKTNRYIEFVNGEFKPYNSGENAMDIAKGNGKVYNLFEICGFSTYFSTSEMTDLWAELDAKTVGDKLFTNNTLPRITTEVKENGVWKERDVTDGFKVFTDELELSHVYPGYSGSTYQLSLYNGKSFQMISRDFEFDDGMTFTIPLTEGISYIGISQYLMDTPKSYSWNNFRWIKVERITQWEGNYKGTLVSDKIDLPPLADLLARIPNTGDEQYKTNVDLFTAQYNDSLSYLNKPIDITATIAAGDTPDKYNIQWHYVLSNEYYTAPVNENMMFDLTLNPASLHSLMKDDSYSREVTFTVDDSIKDGILRLVGKDIAVGENDDPVVGKYTSGYSATIKLEQIPPK